MREVEKLGVLLVLTKMEKQKQFILIKMNRQIIDAPPHSKFLHYVGLANDVSLNLTDQQIQSQTKNQTEGVNNENSGLTKARNHFAPVQDDMLTPEGRFS